MPPKGRGRGRGRGVPRQDQQEQQQAIRPGPPAAQPAPRPPFPAAQPAPRPPSPAAQREFREERVVHPGDGGDLREERTPPQVYAEYGDQRPPGKKEKPRPMHPEELGIQLTQQLVLRPALPVRPGVGIMGRKIKLFANYFPIEIPSGFVYHYDVEIINKRRAPQEVAAATAASSSDKKYRCMSTKRNREVIQAMLEAYDCFRGYKPAYDGQKNLYTRRPLETAQLKLTVTLDDDEPRQKEPGAAERIDRRDVFEVNIKPVQKKGTNDCAISLDPLHALFARRTSTVPQEALMALETILRNGPCFKLVPVGRSFFYPPHPNDLHPLGGGREIWFGYHQSLRLGQWKPMVNIDMTATTFYQKGAVIDFVCEILNLSRDDLYRMPHLKDSEVVFLSKELKGLRIQVTHLRYPRKYRILRLTRDSANRLEFPIDVNGRTIRKKVSDYFFEQYKKRLQYPNLPCLQVGQEAKKVYLPMEVCELVEGQHCKKKLTENQTAEMIKFTAKPPRDRFDEIRSIRKEANFERDPFVNEFGLKVHTEPLSLDGRVIQPPNVRYNNEQRITPKDGSWDMRDKQFFRGAVVESWVFLSFAHPRFCSMQNLEKFAHMLCKIGNESGISINRPALIDIIEGRNIKMANVLDNIRKRYNATLALIVIPAKNQTIYGEVKQAAETILGLTTQCVKDNSVVKKCNPPLVSNLCQKINAKMGGVNNSLMPGETPQILRRPVIIIGADVTHPAPGDKIKPSIAAAVGSLDAHPSRYAVTCRAQLNRDENKQSIEMILDLKTMVVELLKAFYKNTGGKKPEKIIFYRDGVSEGQFENVRDFEIKAVREACRNLSPDYQPGITFIVVQKRHHTRFVPRDSREGVGRMRNIPPGTTVDTDVSHPVNFDFFLCSHFGIQGTSRPSHYTVLEDDNDFNADDLQKLTYYLCHTYVRCTKSISVPSPVQYAHLAAFRARQHLITQTDESSASSDSSAATVTSLPANVMNAIKVKDELKSTMYFV